MLDEKPTLILMMGLPRSGKTTKVAEIIAGLIVDQAQRPAIVNPDSIRLALHGQDYVVRAEPFVWACAKVMVRALFLAGHTHVIIDATNTSRKRRDFWQPEGDDDWQVHVGLMHASYEVCLDRAGDDEAMRKVIKRMAEGWECVADDEEVGPWGDITSPDWLQLWGPEVPTPGHCKRCRGTYAAMEAEGCVPGDCCYRPPDGSDEQRRLRRRIAEMAIRGISA